MPKTKFCVFQIDTEKEAEKTAKLLYLSYDRLVQETGGRVPKSLYEIAYEGEFTAPEEMSDERKLERLFTQVNAAIDDGDYAGRKLSVSDVVVLPSGAWYCDSVGFKKIDWPMGPCPFCKALEMCREYSGMLTCEEVLERYEGDGFFDSLLSAQNDNEGRADDAEN